MCLTLRSVLNFLKIINRVACRFGQFSLQSGTILCENVAEEFSSELFALVVTDDAYLQLLFMSGIKMVVHLAGDECVGSLGYCLLQKEVASSAANGHLADVAFKWLVAQGSVNAECFLHHINKSVSRHG